MKLSSIIIGLTLVAFSLTTIVDAETANVTATKIGNAKNINTYKIYETLRPGMKGSQVSELQSKLRDKGYYFLSIDGKYGPGTVAAVKQFQQSKGLKVDGIAGNNTLVSFGNFTLPSAASSNSICSDVYEPVCAQATVNCIKAPCPQPEPKTMSNSCYAERKGAKILYAGECTTAKSAEQKYCTKEYEPVCGIVKETGDIKTFSNKCEMYASDAEFKNTGTCEAKEGVKKQYTKKDTVKNTYSQEELQAKIESLMKQLLELQELVKNNS